MVSRVVLAESTTLKERTSAMAYMSIAHGLGFSFGPGNWRIVYVCFRWSFFKLNFTLVSF